VAGNTSTPPKQAAWRSRNAVCAAASSVSVTAVGGHSADGASMISTLSHSHGSSLVATNSTNHNDSSPLAAPARRTRSSVMAHLTMTVESESDEGSDFDEEENAHPCVSELPDLLSWVPMTSQAVTRIMCPKMHNVQAAG